MAPLGAVSHRFNFNLILLFWIFQIQNIWQQFSLHDIHPFVDTLNSDYRYNYYRDLRWNMYSGCLKFRISGNFYYVNFRQQSLFSELMFLEYMIETSWKVVRFSDVGPLIRFAFFAHTCSDHWNAIVDRNSKISLKIAIHLLVLVSLNLYIIIHQNISAYIKIWLMLNSNLNCNCGLDLLGEPYRSTRLLQPTSGRKYDGVTWLVSRSVKSINVDYFKLILYFSIK